MLDVRIVRVQMYPRIVVNDAWEGSRAARRRASADIASRARGIASARSKTGAYAASMSVTTEGNITRAVSSDPLAIVKEYGTAHSKGIGALTGAAMSVGARYKGFRVGRR